MILEFLAWSAILAHVKRLEAACYPAALQTLEEVDSLVDLFEHCEAPIHALTWPNGYLVMADHGSSVEVVDMAAEQPLTLRQLRVLWAEVATIAAGRVVVADVRQSTSARLLFAAQQRGLAQVTWGEVWDWNGHPFQAVEFSCVAA
jgi:hypothetical protein